MRRLIEELGYRPNIFAKNLKLGKIFTFGILMPKPSQDSMYWTLPIRGISKASKELAPQKVKIRYFFYDKYSQSSFNKISKEVLEARLDGLVIAPVLSKIFDQFVEKIPSSLPYVFFDSFVPKADYVSYIGQDSFQSGVLSARLMHILVKETGTVTVLKVLPEDYHINDRVEGFLHYFKKIPIIKTRVYDINGNKGEKRRQKIFHRIVSENKDLRGIFVSNASTHRIAEYVHSHALTGKIYIIGYDLIEENVKFLKEGVIDFLISQQSERQGYEAIYALYRYVVLKESVPKQIMMQLDVVTKENIDYYQS